MVLKEANLTLACLYHWKENLIFIRAAIIHFYFEEVKSYSLLESIRCFWPPKCWVYSTLALLKGVKSLENASNCLHVSRAEMKITCTKLLILSLHKRKFVATKEDLAE